MGDTILKALEEIHEGAKKNIDLAVKSAKGLIGDIKHDRQNDGVVANLTYFTQTKNEGYLVKAIQSYHAARIR